MGTSGGNTAHQALRELHELGEYRARVSRYDAPWLELGHRAVYEIEAENTTRSRNQRVDASYREQAIRGRC